MKTRISCLTIALFLTGLMLGGCPTTNTGESILDNPDVQTPTDASSGDKTPADAGDGSNAGDAGSSDDGVQNDDGNGAAADQNNDGAAAGDDQTNDDNGGDDAAGGDDTPAQPAFVGTYSGTLTCTKSESLGGPLGLEKSWNENFDFAFDAAGLPVELTIPGYGQSEGGVVYVAAVNQVGDSVSVTKTRGTYTATLDVSVAIANYDDDSGRIVLQLVHNGVKGALTEVGTGVCVIEFQRSGANLTYSSVTDYEVKLSGMINTLWHVEHQGTLAP